MPPDNSWYLKKGLTPPSHQPHGTTDDIRERLKPLKPHSWRLEGNKLIAKTEMGELVNYIPTDYILEGVDDEGLPKLRKLGI